MELKIDLIKVNENRREVKDSKIKELADSIKEIGLINPITVKKYDDTYYMLIAGLHRLKAVKLLGRDEIESNIVKGSDLEMELIEIDENLMRNELHYIEADELTQRRKNIYEKMYPETKASIGTELVNKRWNTETESDLVKKPSFVEDTSQKTGKSETVIKESVYRAKNLIPEAKDVLKEKDITKTDATKLARLEPEQQKAIVEKIATGEANNYKEAQQKIRKEEKKQEIEEKKAEYQERVEQAERTGNKTKVDIFNTDKKFRIIYADPCWSYNDRQETHTLGGASKHYDTMTIKELSNLPVKDIIEDDAVLFLWVTSPLLEECFDVIKAWGFKYKSSFVWDKIKHNMGHYNSVRHEFLLIATKGSCTPDNKKLYDSVQSIERTEKHSEKPIEFMDIIDDIYTYGDRLEMFARDNKKEKWFYWGNEV